MNKKSKKGLVLQFTFDPWLFPDQPRFEEEQSLSVRRTASRQPATNGARASSLIAGSKHRSRDHSAASSSRPDQIPVASPAWNAAPRAVV